MKRFVSCLIVLSVVLTTGRSSWAQGYDQLLQEAAGLLGQKNYCAATDLFTRAFADSTKTGPYDLYAGAAAAAHCPGKEPLALHWLLRLPRHPNLAVTPRDVDNMAKDEGMAALHAAPEWTRFITQMRGVAAEREAAARRASAQWLTDTRKRALAPAEAKGRYRAAAPGFAMYYAPVDTVQVPYLVYVPRSYQPATAAPLLVYLHGGIVSTPQFQHQDPDVAEEPIFAAADRQQALVLYPFGRKSFGWLQQQAALTNILRMVAQVKARYHVDARRVYLGGMSNGGTAAFWFACQQPAGFAGFYALSAMPTSQLGSLNFKQLSGNAPMYSLNAEDDQVFAYQKVQAIYEQHRAQASQWHFLTRPSGGHGFLYGPDGPVALHELLTRLMAPYKVIR
ncbi:dienelactone hydrolase family protein [Hymenobacter weizhouensis]|uniref:dienelactone hydrolase family protein n=1 Tax=Hymenobacter sp. YIM 151500-1 TaxID=2987689 RepID=UPI00222738EE|nr:PHB depolymerase family esterase [Hymenobacter sp. YIM 151500-1]UYZ63136.1 dienelactone hydrolase family protein [Hymenobacter sp. YIM 151500-1]